MTGSIGVYMPYMNVKKLLDTIGVESGMIKAGKNKGMFTVDREMTEEEKAIAQNIVNEIHEEFIQVVAEGRHMDGQELRKLADGRVYTGKQAKNVGLVDEVGNYYDALAEAAKLGGISGTPIVKSKPKASPLEALLGAKIVDAVKAQFLQSITTDIEGTTPR